MAWLLLGGLAVLHAVYAFTFRLDSDEPQHLHVVWGWTQGQLPYRDFFDNHSPLFAWLCAPVLRALGERIDIVPWMRLAVLPAGALCLGGVYYLGARLFHRRAGRWAAVATGCGPMFFYTSSEFRPDILWAALWVLALAVLLTGPATARRLFFFGVVFGLAFATSMKTSLLAATLGLAAGLALAAGGRQRATVLPAGWPGKAAAAGLGLVLAPGAFAAFFALHGAWQPMSYCLIFHNLLPGLAQDQGWMRWRAWLFPLCLPGLFFGARALLARPGRTDDPWRVQRIVFLLTACAYPLLLVSFWPLVTMQDFLPATPPLALLIVASCFALPGGGFLRASARPLPGALLVAALVAVEITVVFHIHGPWINHTSRQSELLGTVFCLTAPGDPVMDDKGETIFRRRPFYFALENITQERMRRGLIADDIPERLIATRTAVVRAKYLPARARAFVDANYLVIGRLSAGHDRVEPVELGRFSVLGKAVAPGGRGTVAIAVPARYVVLDAAGEPATAVRVDGQPLPGHGGRWLAAGSHEVDAPAGGPRCVFWANAWEKGFLPVALSDSLAAFHGATTPLPPGRPPVDPGAPPR